MLTDATNRSPIINFHKILRVKHNVAIPVSNTGYVYMCIVVLSEVGLTNERNFQILR